MPARRAGIGILVASLGLIAAAVYFYLDPSYYTPSSVGRVPASDTAAPLSAAETSWWDGQGAAPAPIAGIPTGLLLPSIGAFAPVVPVGVERDGTLGVPGDPKVAGWWSGGAAPGEAQGTVVIDGHVDTASSGDGALFHLSEIRPGAPAYLATTAGTVAYRIVARQTYPKAALPPSTFALSGAPRLAVVTCGGPFDSGTRHYLDNVVAYAVPVPVLPPRVTRLQIGRVVLPMAEPADRGAFGAGPPTAPPGGGSSWLAVASAPTTAALLPLQYSGPLEVIWVRLSTVVAVAETHPCGVGLQCVPISGRAYTLAIAAPATALRSAHTGEAVSVSRS